jgi:choline-sulfatase
MCGVDEVDLSPDQLRAARHGYYAAISYLDERVGEVLGALRDARLDDDTIVAFTSDHGEMLGERGLWYKMSFFEHSARVPLLVRVPGAAAARRVAEPVSLLDLAPTLLELTGAPWPDEHLADVDGTSLVGLMTGERATRPGAVLSEYLAEGVNAPAVMVRRGRHKLIVCPGDPDQLFDVAADPSEVADLATEPDHRETASELREEVRRGWDLEVLERRVLASQRERRLVMSGLGGGPASTWAFAPGAAGGYIRGGADLYELQRKARLDVPDAADPRSS